MSIEKEIHQSKFRDEWHKVLVNIMFTSNWVLEEQKAHFDRGGLTPQQYNILRILKGNSPKPLSILQIRERMLDKMSDVSRLTDRMLEKGFINKKISVKDKRLVDITITQKGIELIDWMDKFVQEIDDIMKGLTLNEATQLNNLLDKAREKRVALKSKKRL